jgi:hypothetical protein
MAANLTVTVCNPVKVVEQFTGITAEAIALGSPVRLDTSTGKITGANGTAAGEARCIGLATKAATAAGQTITVVRKGLLDIGNALGNLTYDDDVFLSDTDKTLADTAGTVTLIVGTVLPGLASTTPDKLLRVDL